MTTTAGLRFCLPTADSPGDAWYCRCGGASRGALAAGAGEWAAAADSSGPITAEFACAFATRTPFHFRCYGGRENRTGFVAPHSPAVGSTQLSRTISHTRAGGSTRGQDGDYTWD